MLRFIMTCSWQCLFAIIFCFLVEVNSISHASELVFVTVIWRHGARSPLVTFPSDPYEARKIWPAGRGQLTQVGMKQQYELGRFLRNRYTNLISEYYLDNEMLWMNSTQPELREIAAKIRSSHEYKALQSSYEPFLTKLTTCMGLVEPLTLLGARNVEDVLLAAKSANLTLPNWATNSVVEELRAIVGLHMGISFGGIDYQYRTELAPYAAGPLIKQIIQNMKDRIERKTTYKYFAYSGHDRTIAAVLVALQAYNWIAPPFASSLLFELHKTTSAPSDDVDLYHVKAYYKNTTGPPIPIKLLGCDHACPLSRLIELTNSVTSSRPRPPTFESLLADKSIVGYTNRQYLSTALLVVVALLHLTWLVLVLEACRSKQYRDAYRKIVSEGYQPLSACEDTNESVL